MITVKDIIDHLDLTIKGQDSAKEVLAKALFLHTYNKTKEQSMFGSSGNIDRKDYIYPHTLLTGPTGCGKTEMVVTATEFLDLPLLQIDCSTITPSGYVGDSLSDIILDGLEDFNVSDAPYAVIFMDEFDKLVGTGGLAQDLVAFKKACQYELLKVLEGHSVSKKEKFSADKSMTTDRFCFIFAGNFPELRKDEKVSSIGFGTNAGDKTSLINSVGIIEALQKLGLASQILGRINFIGNLDRLSKEDLTYIVKDKNMALSGMYTLAEAAKLKLSNKTLEAAVSDATKSNLGARGLRFTVINDLMDKIFKKNIGILDSVPEIEELEELEKNLSRVNKDLHNLKYAMEAVSSKRDSMLSDAGKILEEDPEEAERINLTIGDVNESLFRFSEDYNKLKKIKKTISKEIATIKELIGEGENINILGTEDE